MGFSRSEAESTVYHLSKQPQSSSPNPEIHRSLVPSTAHSSVSLPSSIYLASISSNIDINRLPGQLTSLANSNAVTIAATCAAITSVVCGYPFDSIKTRMQVFRFSSTLDCVRSTYTNEGIAGFYRGVVPVVASISVLRSLSFSLYNSGKQQVSAMLPADSDPLSKLIISSSVSGAIAGSVIATLNAPIDFIKLQKQLERMVATNDVKLAAHLMEEAVHSTPAAAASLGEGAGAMASATANAVRAASTVAESAAETSKSVSSVKKIPPLPVNFALTPDSSRSATAPETVPKSRSSWQWARYIVKVKGPSGLYSGYSMHLLRDAIGTSMYFCGYETCKYLLTPTGSEAGPLLHMLSGGMAGSLSWIVLFPIDITKSVLQREALNGTPKYDTALQFVKSRWSKRGLRGFYSGIGPQLLRSFPVHSINFLIYEAVVKWCRNLGNEP
ncbi:mitochondrial carrier domain-containing protein [Phlyctochytrium arcticum]|nr:mitochondrial carrier domain-containing protein [Phlyctochytrium arcticum]